jgi:hypothetical protein
MEKFERELGQNVAVAQTAKRKKPTLVDYVYYASKQRDSERAQDLKRLADLSHIPRDLYLLRASG